MIWSVTVMISSTELENIKLPDQGSSSKWLSRGPHGNLLWILGHSNWSGSIVVLMHVQVFGWTIILPYYIIISSTLRDLGDWIGSERSIIKVIFVKQHRIKRMHLVPVWAGLISCPSALFALLRGTGMSFKLQWDLNQEIVRDSNKSVTRLLLTLSLHSFTA